MNKKPVPTVAVVDTQSVKIQPRPPTPLASMGPGRRCGKLIKGRKRFVIVDTMGHLLWTEVHPANLADGKTGVDVWARAEHKNPLVDDLVLLHADSTFGGHFKRELTDYYDMDPGRFLRFMQVAIASFCLIFRPVPLPHTPDG